MRIAQQWKSAVPGYDKAQQVVNGLGWNLSAHPRQNGEWALFGGDREIATFSDRDEMEAFVAGMALAIGMLPAEVIEQIKRSIQ